MIFGKNPNIRDRKFPPDNNVNKINRFMIFIYYMYTKNHYNIALQLLVCEKQVLKLALGLTTSLIITFCGNQTTPSNIMGDNRNTKEGTVLQSIKLKRNNKNSHFL